MHKILIIGGTTYDHIVYLPEFTQPIPQTIHRAAFHEMVGSTGSGKVLNLTALGLDTVLYSIIGRDYYGELIQSYLQMKGVNVVYDFDPKGTERHVNLMNQQGERISIFVTQSSDTLQLDMDRIEQLIASCDLVILNIVAYTKQLIPLLLKHNKPIWTDLHDYDGQNAYHQPYIDCCQWIFMSSDNLPDYKSTMQEIMALGKELVVCTHGKGGATALTKRGEWIHQPIYDAYMLVDSNGAGDSFFSGYLFGHLRGYSVESCMRLGTLCAGLCITAKELVHPSLNKEMLLEAFEQCMAGDKHQ